MLIAHLLNFSDSSQKQYLFSHTVTLPLTLDASEHPDTQGFEQKYRWNVQLEEVCSIPSIEVFAGRGESLTFGTKLKH